ncbi:MAG: cellulase family glycosylhydrolase, partial [Verrucomicrobiales bacterium]
LDQYQWCGDYPGFAQQALETNHPGAVAMFWAGCGADQNPIPRRSVELAKHYGARLATAVDKVLLTTALQPLDSVLHAHFEEIPLDYANIPTKEQLQADTASDNRYTAARATLLQEQLDRDGALPPTYPFPIGRWSIGTGNPVDFVFLGGETVIDYAIRLKKELHGSRTWVASYSNDVMAYIPSERVLAEGGYEGGAATVYYGLPAPWAPGLEEKIIAAAAKSFQANKATISPIEHKIRIAPDGRSFVKNGAPFRIWGVNYDHNEHASIDGVTGSQLIEEYWHDDWQQVIDDFAEIRALGANVVRVHLQFGEFMSTATEPNQKSLERLSALLKLATNNGLYLDLTGLACYRKADVPDWYNGLNESARWQAQAAFWGAIARTCAGHPAVFCYDLMNEPILDGGEGDDWLPGEPLGGYHFVQRITRDNAGRKGENIAKAWIDTLVSAIRQYDTDTLTTVGVIPWATVFPGAKPLFHDPDASKALDFVSVHFYPKAGEIDKALTALKVYDTGKPVVIEEMFPLACSTDDLLDFVDRSANDCGTDGWISFYWGKTAAELRADPNGGISAAIKAEWLERFAREAKNKRTAR